MLLAGALHVSYRSPTTHYDFSSHRSSRASGILQATDKALKLRSHFLDGLHMSQQGGMAAGGMLCSCLRTR